MSENGADRRDVVVLVEDGLVMTDAAGPLDAFTAANAMGGRYETRTASPGGRAVRATNGLRMIPDLAVEDLGPPVDTLLVAGGPAPGRGEGSALAGTVARMAPRARRVVSVCVGAFVLGEAGLLDGRRATTHWQWCDLLAERHPATRVVPDAIFVRDGPLATSAGITAGIDLALSLVEEDHGARLARDVARFLVTFLQRPGGQSQFSVWSRLPPPGRGPLRIVVDAVSLDPAADHSVPAMAARARVSERHIRRLFVAQLGVTPAAYVERVRVQAAQMLLESGDHGMDSVARRCGFGSAESLRRGFLRLLGITPGAYRARFTTTPHTST
ncbi:GlxA family transcriptional regulator [Microtetraspora sp. NBRC 13810]|uniref:GlxA family transcriptional regulator n=1 Tax=Microtetraspora sp. NBRC 13810 TaxID=3030990 RepID=UPI0025575CF5|nr:GlxA family transcriptional regulator [Microtetraspora sp. NBRC 13810]